MKQTCKKYLLPYLWITLASAVYAFGFNWCYERSGSIWAPIVYHMLSNAISMSLLA